jgi:uncharacterized protein
MKLMFISDIHGSLLWLNRALDCFHQEQADFMVVLGDLLYHGPRNPLPDEYNPKEVAATLNRYKEKILAVRGNCDSEVDQMLIDFPIMAESAWVFHEGRRIYATHGHHHSIENLPHLSRGDIFIQGHTHIPVAERRGDIVVLNPGSVALPKENQAHTYGVMEGLEFRIADLEKGHIVKRIAL